MSRLEGALELLFAVTIERVRLQSQRLYLAFVCARVRYWPCSRVAWLRNDSWVHPEMVIKHRVYALLLSVASTLTAQGVQSASVVWPE
jgi:hypothetical protein